MGRRGQPSVGSVERLRPGVSLSPLSSTLDHLWHGLHLPRGRRGHTDHTQTQVHIQDRIGFHTCGHANRENTGRDKPLISTPRQMDISNLYTHAATTSATTQGRYVWMSAHQIKPSQPYFRIHSPAQWEHVLNDCDVMSGCVAVLRAATLTAMRM